MSLLQPFLFERRLAPKVWGGRMLEQVMGVAMPTGESIGETWELYDRPDGSSRVRGEARTLADLLREDPVAMLGARCALDAQGRFPLLLKFIDARTSLSVQVHPDDEMARAENDRGKDEAWVVLAAGPSARICRGVRPGIDPHDFAEAASSARVEGMLWAFKPQVGDCIDVPAGTVHAIGPDVVVFEVQQNSDVTYRLYDWGRDRDVQVTKALRAARFCASSSAADRPVVVPTRLDDGGELLVANPHFRLRRYAVDGRLALPLHDRFATVTVIGGAGAVTWRDGAASRRTSIARGDTALLPAALGEVAVEASEPATLLVCDPGER